MEHNAQYVEMNLLDNTVKRSTRFPVHMEHNAQYVEMNLLDNTVSRSTRFPVHMEHNAVMLSWYHDVMVS